MNKKIAFLFAIATVISQDITAQTAANNGKSIVSITAGAGSGSMTEKFTKGVVTKLSDGTKESSRVGYDLDYNTTAYSAALEYQHKSGFITMVEGTYTKASFDKYKDYSDEDVIRMDPATFENQALIDGGIYMGFAINRGHRFQVPILGGFRLGYVSGDPINKVGFDFAYRIRARYFFTDKIGLYAGVAGSYGGSSIHDENPPSEKFDGDIDIVIKRLKVEAGLIITLGRKK